MSSNIRINRICQHCGAEFVARTTVTKYCGDDCAKRAYKLRIKEAKIEASEKETLAIAAGPIELLKAKEFLTVREVAKLFSASRQTVYSLINSGKVKAANLSQRKTLIRKTDLDKLFD